MSPRSILQYLFNSQRAKKVGVGVLFTVWVFQSGEYVYDKLFKKPETPGPGVTIVVYMPSVSDTNILHKGADNGAGGPGGPGNGPTISSVPNTLPFNTSDVPEEDRQSILKPYGVNGKLDESAIRIIHEHNQKIKFLQNNHVSLSSKLRDLKNNKDGHFWEVTEFSASTKNKNGLNIEISEITDHNKINDIKKNVDFKKISESFKNKNDFYL